MAEQEYTSTSFMEESQEEPRSKCKICEEEMFFTEDPEAVCNQCAEEKAEINLRSYLEEASMKWKSEESRRCRHCQSVLDQGEYLDCADCTGRLEIEKVFKPNRDKNFHDFDVVVSNRVKKIQSILGSKAKEYASGKDRYHNFHKAARMRDTTPERALDGMMMKHVVSVDDLLCWIDECPEKLTVEIVEEKIGDHINYLILLEGLLKKRIAERN